DRPLATLVPYSTGPPCPSARPQTPHALPLADPAASGFVLAGSGRHRYPPRGAALYRPFSMPVVAFSVFDTVFPSPGMLLRSWHPDLAPRGMLSPRPRPFAYANRGRQAVRSCRRDLVPVRYRGEIRLRLARFHPNAYR